MLLECHTDNHLQTHWCCCFIDITTVIPKVIWHHKMCLVQTMWCHLVCQWWHRNISPCPLAVTTTMTTWVLFYPFNNYHKLIWLLLLSFNVHFKDCALYGGFLEAGWANFWTCCLEMKWWHSIFRIIIIGTCMSCCCPTNKEGGCYSLHKVFDQWQGNLGSWTHPCNTSYDFKVKLPKTVRNGESQIYNQRYWVESWGFN